MMSHSDKETNMYVQDASNIPNKNDKNMTYPNNKYQTDAEQYEHWDQTLSFPSYVIDGYKNKYPTTYAELRLDGLSKQQSARYIYRNYELCSDKMFDMNDDYDGPIRKSGFGFIRYLSD